MQVFSKDVDDLDIEDREYMDVVRKLKNLNMEKFLDLYLKAMEPDLYDKMISILIRQKVLK